jgi:hypothetical protein
VYASIPLLPGGVIDMGLPGWDGVWSQNAAGTSLTMEWVELATQEATRFEGASVSSTCFEGLITMPPQTAVLGALRACVP